MAPLYGATPRGLTTSASASFPVHALTWLPGGTPPRARTLCTSRDRLDARDDARSRGRRRGSSCSFNQLGKARQEGRGHPRSELPRRTAPRPSGHARDGHPSTRSILSSPPARSEAQSYGGRGDPGATASAVPPLMGRWPPGRGQRAWPGTARHRPPGAPPPRSSRGPETSRRPSTA